MCRYPRLECHHDGGEPEFGYNIRYQHGAKFTGSCLRVVRDYLHHYVYMFTVGHSTRFSERPEMMIVPYHYRIVNIIDTSQATGKRRVPPDPGVRRLR